MTLHLQRKDDRKIVVTVYEGRGVHAYKTTEVRMTVYPSLYSAFCDEERLSPFGEPIAWNFQAGAVFYKSERGMLLAVAEL